MDKVETSVSKYIKEREKIWNAMGIFRCDAQVDGEETCKWQCDKCKSYYVEKINDK